MITITTAIAKGGSGKTSLAVHHAVGLAQQGKRTLLVDLDPQADATLWTLGRISATSKGVADALLDEDGPKRAHFHDAPGRKNLRVLPATPALVGAETKLAGEVGGFESLRFVLDQVRDDFDFVVVDTAPNLNLCTVNGLLAADAVLVPVLPAFFSLAGLERLQKTLERMQKRSKSVADILGFVLFATDAREAVTAEVREVLEKASPGKTYKAEIRVNTVAKSLPAQRQTAFDVESDAKGAKDHKAVLTETLARLGQSKAPKPARKARK